MFGFARKENRCLKVVIRIKRTAGLLDIPHQPLRRGKRHLPPAFVIRQRRHGQITGDKICRRLHDHFENRRCVIGGLADHSQHIGTGGLSRQRCLRFIEQADIFNCDDRLIREGFRHRDFIGGKGAFCPAQEG